MHHGVSPKIPRGQKEASSHSQDVVHEIPSLARNYQQQPQYVRPAGTASQDWRFGLDASSLGSSLVDWRTDYNLAGGFVNLLQNSLSHSLPTQIPARPDITRNFAGAPSHYIPVSTPQPSVDKKRRSGASNKLPNPIDIESGDNDNEEARTGKRLAWTSAEDERLMSAWLKNSNDPIGGNFKKNDQYWREVTAEYNSTTPISRHRQVKQALTRWHRVNKMINKFHKAYKDVSGVYVSGQSEKQLMEKVHKLYEKDNGVFLLYDTWMAVRNAPKWYTYNAALNGSNKRDFTDVGGVLDQKLSSAGTKDIPRPKGGKAAKTERDGKVKGSIKSTDMEEFDKYFKEANKNRAEVLEVQQRISADKLESSRLILLAAKEKKEAKTKSKMLEQYGKLITHDTSRMSNDQKSQHMLAINLLRQELFPNSQ